MKRLIGVIFTIFLSFTLNFTVGAQENNMMPGLPGMPGFPNMPGMPGFSDMGHNMCFKIADLDIDEVPEIVMLTGNTIVIMDNAGNVIFAKTVEGLDNDHFMGNSEKKDIRPLHMGGIGGMGRLDVADIDLDFDQLPEIIILDSEKLIVLDNTGEPKSIIPLPEIVVIQEEN